MRSWKHVLGVVFLILFGLIVSLVLVRPMTVLGGPLPQTKVTPRPTVGLPTPTVESMPVTRRLDLALIVDKSEVEPGDLLTYKIQVSNGSGHQASNLWLTCDLPAEVNIESYSTSRGMVQQYGQRLSFELGNFKASYESLFIEIKARVKQDLAPGTELIHHVNLTSDQAGGGEGTIVSILKGEMPEPMATAASVEASESQEKSTLPVTGNDALPLWIILGFTLLISAVALISSKRESLHLSNLD